MSQFSTHKWFRNQKLSEQQLNENKVAAVAQAIDKAIESVDGELHVKYFAQAVAEVLKGGSGTEGYGSHLFNEFMEVLHAELGMGEELNETEEMATYKVHVVTSDPYEGGPDEWFDHEVKVDASLSGDELKAAIKDAVYDLGYTRRSIYKMNYEKA